MSKKFTPEFNLYVMESRLNLSASFLYEVLPEGAARFLKKVFPKNTTVRSVLEVYDFRQKHGFPPGYIPANFQLPQKEQG